MIPQYYKNLMNPQECRAYHETAYYWSNPMGLKHTDDTNVTTIVGCHVWLIGRCENTGLMDCNACAIEYNTFE